MAIAGPRRHLAALQSTGCKQRNQQPTSIVGLGVSSGVYRGRVKVIRTADRLHTLRAGDVLVCPTTSAAWMLVFRRAGAIVADTGQRVVAHGDCRPRVAATKPSRSLAFKSASVMRVHPMVFSPEGLRHLVADVGVGPRR